MFLGGRVSLSQLGLDQWSTGECNDNDNRVGFQLLKLKGLIRVMNGHGLIYASSRLGCTVALKEATVGRGKKECLMD